MSPLCSLVSLGEQVLGAWSKIPALVQVSEEKKDQKEKRKNREGDTDVDLAVKKSCSGKVSR